jgi:oligoribonuclease NrnB/cAMP/cGMP phosphodiesterase (DHH superfamily)
MPVPDRRVTLVSHGPNCLDGLTCAVVAARYFAGRRFEATFVSNRLIDEALQEYGPTNPDNEELWITDISWRDRATDVHLERLVSEGLELYWVDHHKSAIDRRAEGHLQVSFTDYVLDDSYAASRLLFNYLCDRAAARGESRPGLLASRNLVLLADDVDRWILHDPRSRELALAVRAMEQEEAYRVLLAMDSNITYGPEVQRALEKVDEELKASFALARSTRHVEPVAGNEQNVVAAECDGYAGEIADRWGREYAHAVFALYDHRSDGISLRRSPDSSADLSRIAAGFGGGGHPAAAGCEITTTSTDRSAEIARRIAEVLQSEAKS